MSGPGRTPEWLLAAQPGLCPCARAGRRRRAGWLGKTIDSATAVLHEALAGDETARAAGWLQRLDARAKLAAGLVLLIAAALVHSVLALVAIAVAAAAAAISSRVPAGRFLARVWLAVPLFSGIVALPAVLNVVTPGPELVGLGTWFGHDLAVTAPGASSAVRLVARTGASLSVVLAVTATTPWNGLLAALSRLRVPAVFVAVAAMGWRYALLLAGTVSDMLTARRARGAGATGRRRRDAIRARSTIAATAGTALVRSHQLSGEVYLAMVARGYTGHVRSLEPERARPADRAFTAAAVAAAVAVVIAERALAG